MTARDADCKPYFDSFPVTVFPDHAARSKELRDLTAVKLVELIRATTAPTKQLLP